jgi:predicted NUDIX family NTP pyrophosphohydrolase
VPTPKRRSAGLLLYRRTPGGTIQVLLAHPGGPIWATRDEGAWTVPKGEVEDGEDDLDVARREFEEETGHRAPDGEPIDLGEIRQKGGKVVVAWALEGDLDPATQRSNTFPFEWPPRSGRWITVPEIDRVDWFGPDEARRRIKETQWPLVERLLAVVRR